MEAKELEVNAEAVATDNALPKKITKEDFQLAEATPKAKAMQWIRLIAVTIISSFLIAFTVYGLIKPNNFTIGGIAGMAVLINHMIPVLEIEYITFALNIPLLILALIYLKRKFAILSVMNIGMQSLWMFIFRQCNMFTVDFSGGANADKIFAAIAAGLCFGVAIALAYKIGSSTGGGDIMAVLIQRKVGASSIAWILMGINATVIGASFFVFYDTGFSTAYNLLPIMLSTFEMYIESKANEFVTNGAQSAREFRIITDKPEQMAHALMKELSRGVTAIPATGMYTKITHTMLLCVVSRRQVATLKRIMKKVDPDSFAVMSNVSQVLGLGFYTGE
jgi:uncharacterized membrane-anchored protein YitT (DUF2179 family)